MDRQIVYAGSIPLETDLLNIQRNVQVALGALARAVLGDGGLIDGMGIAPGGDAYSVVVGPGNYTAPAPNDANAFGALAADATAVLQTGLLKTAESVQLGPPLDPTGVLCWLVQARLRELDATPLALPYWNAGNPSVPFAGPGNDGLAQPTQRVLRVQLGSKVSAAQAISAGVPRPPEPDAGWVGLCSVRTYLGKPGIEASDIDMFHSVPRLRFPLPALPPGTTRQEAHTTTVSWQVPDGVRWVRVRLVGGGGGGGGGDTAYSGGGGGAGGFAEAYVPVEPRQFYPVIVGPGGAGGSAVFTGSSGGTTSFGISLVAATGGQGGASNNPDSHGGSPGVGALGSMLQPGGYGGDGTRAEFVPGGNGGASAFGGGGRGANQGGYPALGLAAGSGGGGGYGLNSNGGTGAPGIVVLEW